MKKIKKINDFEPLSNDITTFIKNDDGSLEKISEPINILQITGLITDENEIKKIEEGFTLDTSITVKDIKRGDIIYLTALLERTSGSSINSQKMGVLKLRVIDYYIGLNKLNQVIPIKK